MKLSPICFHQTPNSPFSSAKALKEKRFYYTSSFATQRTHRRAGGVSQAQRSNHSQAAPAVLFKLAHRFKHHRGPLKRQDGPWRQRWLQCTANCCRCCCCRCCYCCSCCCCHRRTTDDVVVGSRLCQTQLLLLLCCLRLLTVVAVEAVFMVVAMAVVTVVQVKACPPLLHPGFIKDTKGVRARLKRPCLSTSSTGQHQPRHVKV